MSINLCGMKHIPIVTGGALKVSEVNRKRRLLFPTPESPTNTNLME